MEIWIVRLDVPPQSASGATKFLSPEERTRADAFRNEQAHRNYVISHAALRQILANHLKLNPAEIPFRTGTYGKPALAGSVAGRLEFNLTHSGSLALVALTTGAEVGVDVETVRPMPDALRIAERFFSAAESDALKELPVAEQAAAFLNLWTRKESLAKATGFGIANSLARFAVTWGTQAAVTTIAGDTRQAAQWSLHSFQPAPGYVAAVAIHSPSAQFAFHEFQMTA